jgi:hypothetical protein
MRVAVAHEANEEPVARGEAHLRASHAAGLLAGPSKELDLGGEPPFRRDALGVGVVHAAPAGDELRARPEHDVIERADGGELAIARLVDVEERDEEAWLHQTEAYRTVFSGSIRTVAV